MKLFSSGTSIITPSANTKKIIAHEFASLKKKKQSLTILILLFICMMGWAVVSIFSTQRDSKIDPETLNLAKPLNPVIDVEALSTLEGKRSFTTEELSKFTIYKAVVDSKTQDERIIPIDEELPPPDTSGR